MKELLSFAINTPSIKWLTIAYLLVSSITTFGIRITQAKRNGTWPSNEPDLPSWTSVFYWVEWIIFIIIAYMNWRYAIALYLFKFILHFVSLTIFEFTKFGSIDF